ncbi:MAG: PAS domain S-box protein [Bacteroidetes bacterium]|nr:PAS domain S-box protein [Bacteroidota bacterium]
MKEDKNISSKAALFQQNTEERLRKSEMRYQNLFDLSPNGLLLEDLNGIILDVNISFCKSLGYKKEELIGKNIQIIIPKEDTDKILPNIKKIISETAMFHTTRNLKKDGNLCWMELKEILVSLPNDDEGILVVSNDITEQIQMEANLRESEYFFKESQRAAFIGSYKVNFQTGIWESSDVLDSIFGIEKFYERTIDSWIDIIYPEDQEMMHKYLLEEVIAKHTSFNKEYRIIRKLDNEIRWVQGKGEIKIDQSDNVVSMIGTIQDITEHKLSEEKLIEIESNARKNNELLRSILESPKGIIIFSLDTKYQYTAFTNSHKDTMKHIWGADIKVGMNMLDIILNPDDRQKAKCNFDSTLQGKHLTLIEEYGDDNLFRTSWENRYSPIYDHNEIIVGLTVFVTDITERKHIEKLLIDKEADLRKAQEIAKIGSWKREIDGKGWWSDEMYHIYGVSADTFTINKENILNLVHPDDRKKMETWNKACSEGKSPGELEFRVIHPNGEICYISGRGELTYNSEGKPLFINGTAQDITEHKQAENELIKAKIIAQESEAKFRAILENSQDAIGVSKNGNLIFSNSEYLNLYGYNSSDELIGKPTLDQIAPQEKAKVSEITINRENGKNVPGFYETIGVRKNGEEFPFEVKAGIFYFENELYNIAIIRDITERKLSEQKLLQSNIELNEAKEKAEESEERLFTFMNSIPDIVCYKDGEGRWLLANDADLELFDLVGVDYFGKTDIELCEFTNTIYKNAFTLCMESDELAWTNKGILQGIEKIPTLEGKIRTFEVYKIPIFYADGQRKGLAVIGRDITTLHETNEKLNIAKDKAEEASRLKSSLLSNMSHELRTPMAGILGFSEVLTHELTNPAQIKMVNSINKSGKRLMATLNSIMDLSLLESASLKVDYKLLHPVSCINNVFELFRNIAEDKNLDLDLIVKDKNIVVRVDYNLFQQVISSLIDNALKFTKKGGIKIEIDSKQTDGKVVFICRVNDTGIGIPKEMQELIFNEFRQASEGIARLYEGNGLGLTIAHKIVNLMNGKIKLESELGIGSTFTIELPGEISEDNTKKNSVNRKKVANTIIPLKGKDSKLPKVLYVEDNEINIQLTKVYLQNICDFEFVTDGEAAIEKVQQTQYNIILMDINLGHGIDGIETTKKIRSIKEYKDTPIIAVTGYTMPDEIENILAGGCNKVITKPFTKAQILELISLFT